MSQQVYLIDDDEAIRASLSLLMQTMQWQVNSYSSVDRFLQETQRSEWDGIILLDIRMPGKSGLTLLEALYQHNNIVPVIIMTGHGNIDLCRRAFKNGAYEFLTKPIDADLLLETLDSALIQYQQQRQEQLQQTQCLQRFNELSPREAEVAKLIMAGKTSKEIARELRLSPRTVETHRTRLFTKLDVHSLSQLFKSYGFLSE